MPAGARSEVEKAAEEIRFNADLKARIVPEIRKWLNQKVGSSKALSHTHHIRFRTGAGRFGVIALMA